MDQLYREKVISQIETDADYNIKLVKIKLQKYQKKISSLDKALYGMGVTTSVCGLASISSLAVPGLGIALGILSGVCGIVTVAIKTVDIKTNKKIRNKLLVLAAMNESKSKLELIISSVFDDGEITIEEFQEILDCKEEHRKKINVIKSL